MNFLFTLFAAFLAISAHAKGTVVSFTGHGLPPGSILVKNSERKLYFILEGGKAIRYPVAIGQPGLESTGSGRITQKMIKPAWGPPAIARQRNPKLPAVIPGGHPSNPLGAAALILSYPPEVAIHGNSNARSIGTQASLGCVRMHNEDILDLYGRVTVGTPVLLLP